ncbi:MAG TPA: hypothetical protein VNM14_22060 [Planctomycetota bacterium]|jgi:hypothetical protein|nr:hypothetical protein [Planctomycetota bacterium]
MNCLKCNHKNPGTIAYCQKCGAKMDFTADEIAGSLVEKARAETAQSTEHYARHTLTFAAVIFLVAVTLFVLSLGAPDDSYYIPALSRGAEHVKVEHKINPDIKKLPIPFEIRKR